MPINSVSPSFGGKITDIKTSMNIKKVSKMLSPAYATRSEKYEDGSFVVKGYDKDVFQSRKAAHDFDVDYEYDNIWDEEGLECYVEYTPEDGLFTEIRSQDYDDVFYTITQEEGYEPEISPVETEIDLPNNVLNINESFIEKMNTVFRDQHKIYELLGKFIPTLENLKL
jgi:hypothetical protein